MPPRPEADDVPVIASESDDRTFRLLKLTAGDHAVESDRAHGMRTGSTNDDGDFSWFGYVSGRRPGSQIL